MSILIRTSLKPLSLLSILLFFFDWIFFSENIIYPCQLLFRCTSIRFIIYFQLLFISQHFVLPFHDFELLKQLRIAQAALFVIPPRDWAAKPDMTVFTRPIWWLSMSFELFMLLSMFSCMVVGPRFLRCVLLLAPVATQGLLRESLLHCFIY